MTNQEAIENLKGQIKCLKCETGIDCEKCRPNWSIENDIESLDKAIEALENQKTGHWIRLIEDYPECDFEFKGCSVCRTHYPNFAIEQFRYCPNCGAYMIGE